MMMGKKECENQGYLLCVAGDFLFNLLGLKDAFSFLENRDRVEYPTKQNPQTSYLSCKK